MCDLTLTYAILNMTMGKKPGGFFATKTTTQQRQHFQNARDCVRLSAETKAKSFLVAAAKNK